MLSILLRVCLHVSHAPFSQHPSPQHQKQSYNSGNRRTKITTIRSSNLLQTDGDTYFSVLTLFSGSPGSIRNVSGGKTAITGAGYLFADNVLQGEPLQPAYRPRFQNIRKKFRTHYENGAYLQNEHCRMYRCIHSVFKKNDKNQPKRLSGDILFIYYQ